ncbi:carbohydrate ABC transporter permease [Nonomuraea sp. PA05]|uniref:carbohydrate ABC transporter permease n=1 Tax=Nonomuraea sp. PA05 TaxID=2604466 RepID=UPI0011D49679|nr:carbohydrate ABC transporter permease [Nonomuraea sp. PA05]TYB47630.1 carbohydrate ABC transporter permease [Nonomuraea sp. PA05]
MRRRIFDVLVTALVAVWTLVPLVWVVSLSLKPATLQNDGRFLPDSPTLDNYTGLFTKPMFTSALANSVGISLIATTASVAVGAVAAYAIARLRFRGSRAVLAVALSLTMFPAIALVGPLFTLWTELGLFDTWLGLIIPYVSFSLPLAIWLLTAFFRTIPADLEESAQVDGATRLQALLRVILPVAAPGVVTTFLLTFIACWGEFLFAISLTSTESSRTVPAALAFFTGDSEFQQPYGAIAAAALLVTVPVVVLVLLAQRRIVAGLTSGAVKG